MQPLFSRLERTIFSEMTALAEKHGAVNLGQGFPEDDGAPELRRAAARALGERSNQYPPSQGLGELRRAVADHYARFSNVVLDAETEVLVTSGATEALAATLLAIVAPGDEVVCFEPLYDAYAPLVERAGGVLRVGRLEPPDFLLTAELLERTLTERTRVVLLNTPHNPGASIIDAAELEPLARHAARHGTTIVSDEVWEHVTFDGARHQSLLSVPDLRDHVVKIGSAGKMFALTGWKVGFVCAAPRLTRAVSRAHQFLTFTTPPALQVAVAEGLGYPARYFDQAADELATSRDRLAGTLASAGVACLPSRGTYFLNVDLRASGVALSSSSSAPRDAGVARLDVAFARRAVTEFGVAVIPLSAFYLADPPDQLVRVCFAKRPGTLDEGAARLITAIRSFAVAG